jgi:hypothetical protein
MDFIGNDQKNSWGSMSYAEKNRALYLKQKQTQDLFLRSEIVDHGYGKLTNAYRLYAKEPHTIEMALAYDIECPECRHDLKQIGRCVNSHKLGLYRCPACDRAKGVN